MRIHCDGIIVLFTLSNVLKMFDFKSTTVWCGWQALRATYGIAAHTPSPHPPATLTLTCFLCRMLSSYKSSPPISHGTLSRWHLSNLLQSRKWQLSSRVMPFQTGKTWRLETLQCWRQISSQHLLTAASNRMETSSIPLVSTMSENRNEMLVGNGLCTLCVRLLAVKRHSRMKEESACTTGLAPELKANRFYY